MTAEEQIQKLTSERDAARADLKAIGECVGGDPLAVRGLVESMDAVIKERDAALKALRDSEELSRMQLCAVMTASVQNTESTIKERIDRSNPYWTQGYADVCAAVDREMRERVAKEAALKACAAVLHSIRKEGMVIDHSDEVQLLLNAIGERRTEQDAQEMLQHKLQLLNRAETAEKACAEMRELLDGAEPPQSIKTDEEAIAWINKREHALSSDCGKGYVKAESLKCFKCDDGHTPLYCLNCAREGYHHDDEWKVVVEALRFTIQSSVENGPEAIAECIDRLEQALAHAEKLTSQ